MALWFKKSSRKIAARGHFAQTAQLRYKVGYRRNGQDFWVTDWRNNLILDSGLNKLPTVLWAQQWAFCLFGNPVSPTPVRRDSSPITFTVTGSTCTASGSFFVSGDVGRLIKFNDANGQEFYITAFTSSTVVTLGAAPSPAITTQTATIWYVNDTALNTLFSTTSTVDTPGGSNGTSVAANVCTFKRTFVGAAVVAPVTLTEIGFNNSAANSALFDRDIIAGGVSLLVGDQPLAVCNVIITVNPGAATAAGNVGTGFDSSGSAVISGLDIGFGVGISAVAANGSLNQNGAYLEPFSVIAGGSFQVLTTNFTLPAFSNGAGPTLGTPAVNATGAGKASYSAGNFYQDVNCSWATTVANGTIYGIVLGGGKVWYYKFTTPIVKTSLQTFSLTFRFSWQRALVN